MLDFAKGYPTSRLLPNKIIADAAQKVLLGPDAAYTLQYDADYFQGPPKTREALARFLTKELKTSVPVKADNIAMTNGASQTLSNLLTCFTDTSYTQTAFFPTYSYFLAYQMFRDGGYGGQIRNIKEDNEGLVTSDLESKLRKEVIGITNDFQAQLRSIKLRTATPKKYVNGTDRIFKHVLYLVPTFCNPTGSVMSLERRKELIRIARHYDILIICDDVYELLYFAEDRSKLPPRLVELDIADGGAGNVISNGSFSKILSPGFRSGYIEGAPALIEQFSRLGLVISGSNNGHFQANLLLPIIEGPLESHVKELRDTYRKRAHDTLVPAVEKHLVPLGCKLASTPQGGYFTWLELGDNSLSAKKIAEVAIEIGLTLVTSSKFDSRTEGGHRSSAAPSDGDSAIRLCWSYLEADEIASSVELLAKAIQTCKDAQK